MSFVSQLAPRSKQASPRFCQEARTTKYHPVRRMFKAILRQCAGVDEIERLLRRLALNDEVSVERVLRGDRGPTQA